MSSTLIRTLTLPSRPDLLRWQQADPGRFPALLESAAVGAPLGRFDILLRAVPEVLTLEADGSLSGRAGGGGFLAALDRWWQTQRVAAEPGPWPFHGGWFVYLGYELAGEVEPRLRLSVPPGPIAHAVRCPAAVIHDHLTGLTAIVAERGHEALLDELEAAMREPPPDVSAASATIVCSEDPPGDYLAAVECALEHIARGDIYQANLARKWAGHVAPGLSAGVYYRNLRQANPGPFSGLAQLPDRQVLCTSPERLVEVRDGWVQTRPIAGTRPRQADDAAAIDALVASAKERAEHVMLIDLERNDLGRICEPGTVEVSEFGVVESYAHVHHLVSNVRGRLLRDVTPGGVIRALFPGGTITGCPKVRCMELISQIEGAGRGAYTGSFGYLNRDGTLDLNILIRTATVSAGRIEIRAGAGIVADSVPQRELDETRAKARGLLRGLGSA